MSSSVNAGLRNPLLPAAREEVTPTDPLATRSRLTAYGVLRPGQPNNAILGEIDDAWRECELEGEGQTQGSLPAFRWAPTGKMYRAMLFESEGLPAAWPRLDEFEGPSYRRHLVTAKTDDDVAVVVSAFVFHGAM